MMENVVKKCSKCNEVKSCEEFHRNKTRRDGRIGCCKTCSNKIASDRRRAITRLNLLQVERDGAVKKCSKCKGVKSCEEFHKARGERDGRQYYCKACAREKKRLQNRKSKKGMVGLQIKATNKVYYAIRKGRVQRLPCIVCGGKAQAHHSDYSKPLDVDWLCRKHHDEPLNKSS